MEAHNSQDGHIVQVRDSQNMGRNFVGASKICGEAPCGFADGGISTRDAQERYTSMKKLIVAMVLCVIFMSVEVVGGIKANSLAILTDAAHLLSDVAAFAISLFSLWAATWEATPQQSYGFFRIEILGALVSIQMIWLLAGILVYEAILRLIDDTGSVNGFLMFLIAAFGLVVNIIMALFLGHDHGHHGHGHGHGHSHSHGHGHGHGHEDNGHLDKGNGHGHHTHSQTTMTITSHDNPHHHHHHHAGDDHHHHGNEHTLPLLSGSSTHNETEEANEKKRRNINVQGAYLHVLGDSIQSVGVMIGGAVIWLKPEWKIIDLICTLIFSVIVLGTTIKMIRDILEVLMESTPREIDATKLQTGLLEMEEVIAIHELHIWAITVGKILLACHVKIRPEANADLVLDKVIDYIRREYNISHVTIQIERG